MSIVKCTLTDCEYNKDLICNKDFLYLDAGECDDYVDITEGEDYQEIYYKACKRKDEGIPDEQYRIEAKGKRVDYRGYSFYTNQDIRDGLNGISFTEKKSGYALSLYSLKMSDKNFEKFEEQVKAVKDVMELPLYKYVDGELVKVND